MPPSPTPLAALSWMDDPRFVAAALPLLQDGHVEALEWSFDTRWTPSDTTAAVLDTFAASGRLTGHGVTLSPLSATWTPRQETWMNRLAAEVARRPYRHISEHLGFSTTGDRTDGTPLPMPLRDDVVAIGIDRLQRLASVSGRPVGLENLALALGPNDVRDEPALLEALLAPVDGFLVLDLHNLWCRSVNNGVPLAGLIARYPLNRVRELHISGGSWDGATRRDTHDDRVPNEVFDALSATLADCPNAELVVLEQVGPGLATEAQQRGFRTDFQRLREVLDAH